MLCIICAAHTNNQVPFAGTNKYGRLVAVKEPPLALLRGLAVSAGSHMSHQTGQELLQAYHLAPDNQQQFELLTGGSLPTGHNEAEISAAMQDSCSPADSGDASCSEGTRTC